MAFLIRGANKLCGTVSAQGAKNAALPMLFATLLCKEPVTLYGLPEISDVQEGIAMLCEMGVRVAKDEQGGTVFDAGDAVPPSFALTRAKKIRASAYALGAALSRFGEGAICYPGGCALGCRPLDYHKAAFLSLGCAWEETEEGIRVTKKEPRSAFFVLPYPSVGATVNFILCALGCPGKSSLYGYAKEQHILDFISFLRKMGAHIFTEGDLLHVEGGSLLGGGEYRVISDGMEAGTYLIAAAVCGGEVTVKDVRYSELSSLFLAFGRMGISFCFQGESVTVLGNRGMRGTHITAAPYPAFPTDLHPPMAVLLSQTAQGGSISDLVWRDRYHYIEELKKMGLCVHRTAGGVTLLPCRLHGAAVTCPDLRGGAALVVAALAAEGETLIEGEEILFRGYSHLLEKLFSVGADISVQT